MSKKLVTLQRVSSVEPIEGADKIVKIIVDGHTLVTQKSNNLQEGSFVAYFSVDAMIPAGAASFDWLESNRIQSGDGTIGYRITPMKRKGITSDGLCLPLSYFEETGIGKILSVMNFYEQGYDSMLKFYDSGNKIPIQEGADLTAELGVTKFN